VVRRTGGHVRCVGLVAILLLAACAVKTPSPRIGSPADAETARRGSESRPAPAADPMPGPIWKSPDPFEPGATQPRGFAVLDADRRALRLDRREDGSVAEIWRPSGPLPTTAFAMIDPARIDAIEPWIAVLELAADDPARHPDVPPRRAVDGVIARPTTSEVRGLAIVLGSLARLNPPEQWLVAEFLSRGWTVLVSSPPVSAPDDRTGGVTTLRPGLDPAEAGRALAADIDAGLGVWRDGLRDLISRLDVRGDLPGGPTVLVGASSGALAAPIIADALRPVRPIDAVALIAGGASPPTILARTTLADEDLRLDRRGPRVDDVDLPTFVEAFESSSRLQSPAAEATTAARLAGVPVLILESGFDTAIPASARARLRTMFPGAEHWWYPLGHYGLFIALSIEAGPLVDWLERAVHADSDADGLRNPGKVVPW